MMALGNVLGEPTKPGEVRSAHYRDSDRYVVSLVATFGADGGLVNTPQMALASTLGLIYDGKSDQTVWLVHDRHTGETYAIEQGDCGDLAREIGVI